MGEGEGGECDGKIKQRTMKITSDTHVKMTNTAETKVSIESTRAEPLRDYPSVGFAPPPRLASPHAAESLLRPAFPGLS